MGEGGGGEALSLFRFHLSPFPQKRLILRLAMGQADDMCITVAWDQAPHWGKKKKISVGEKKIEKKAER